MSFASMHNDFLDPDRHLHDTGIRHIGRRLPRRSWRKAYRRGTLAAWNGTEASKNPYGEIDEAGSAKTVQQYLARAWRCGWTRWATGWVWREGQTTKTGAAK
jgi:hypothetical protein